MTFGELEKAHKRLVSRIENTDKSILRIVVAAQQDILDDMENTDAVRNHAVVTCVGRLNDLLKSVDGKI